MQITLRKRELSAAHTSCDLRVFASDRYELIDYPCGRTSIMEDSGIDSDPKPLHDDRLQVGHGVNNSQASDSSCSSTSITSPLKNKSKHLERRGDRGKRTQRTHKRSAGAAAGLIPIQRLPIPGPSNRHPLVDWDTDDSEEDINFFPVSRSRETRQELTDTFSIENMPLSAEEDDDEEDLDLLPPQAVGRGRPWTWCCQCSLM